MTNNICPFANVAFNGEIDLFQRIITILYEYKLFPKPCDGT